MSCPGCLQPFIILSSRIVNNRLLDIRGFTHEGILDIELVQHPEIPLGDEEPSLAQDDALDTIEAFREGLMDRLGEREMTWLRMPISGVYSLEVRQAGRAVLFWMGREKQVSWAPLKEDD
ncbi:hypothetical protein [Desulfoplanes formicivorans]|uniref:Uncharacterized protein n=1 Tax=Desulfoplanes formicivorans TaxID=1592317 RepID=A0A194AEV4_9BACT|nr:hypothetical protein [Desulfoplanes formicivorans]GAU08602.1 hypothetical protein DPF_1316 [Desulfoplanes formicivorans]